LQGNEKQKSTPSSKQKVSKVKKEETGSDDDFEVAIMLLLFQYYLSISYEPFVISEV
jgi:hypothetical protein